MGSQARFRALAACCALVLAAGTVALVASPEEPRFEVATDGSARAAGADRSTGSVDGADPEPGGSSTTQPGASTTAGSSSGRRSSRVGTTATAPSPTSTTALGRPQPTAAALVAPPAPGASHATLWGQVTDVTGRALGGVCVSLSMPFRFQPATVLRTAADGTYRATEPIPPESSALLYGLHVDACPDDPRDVIAAGVNQDAEYNPLRVVGGEVRRTDFALELAPTLVDLTVVDPAGRPVQGVCVSWYDDAIRDTHHVAVDDRGRAQIVPPRVRDLQFMVDGVCDRYLGYNASFSYQRFTLPPGRSSIRYVVPWSNGDDMHAPLFSGSALHRFDLLSLSVQAGEPDPSCIGAFTRSRWFQVDSFTMPGTAWTSGPIIGGFVTSNLERGGTLALWGLDETGRLVEVGCARAGTPIAIPTGRFPSVRVQVIPDGEVAGIGEFQWVLRMYDG